MTNVTSRKTITITMTDQVEIDGQDQNVAEAIQASFTTNDLLALIRQLVDHSGVDVDLPHSTTIEIESSPASAPYAIASISTDIEDQGDVDPMIDTVEIVEIVEANENPIDKPAEDNPFASPLASDEMPIDFWGQIDQQLRRIMRERPTTFDQVRDILNDPRYTRVYEELTARGGGSDNTTQFVGNDRQASLALTLAVSGWDFRLQRGRNEGLNECVLHNQTSGELITYDNGLLARGDCLPRNI